MISGRSSGSGGASSASEVSFDPPPGMVSENVQDAIEELRALIFGGPNGSVTPFNATYGDGSASKTAKVWNVPGATKALLAVHGGGWNGGLPGPWYPYADALANERGITVVVIEYPKGSAINGRYLVENPAIVEAGDYIRNLVSPGCMVVAAGESAGGQLTALQAYSNPGFCDAVISISTPHSLQTQYLNPTTQALVDGYTGVTPADGPLWNTRLTELSPITYPSPGGVPCQLFHAPQDYVALPASSDAMYGALVAAGIAVDYQPEVDASYGLDNPDYNINSHGIAMFPYIFGRIGDWIEAL